ncbi:hypothetical protein J2X31_003654 [Flavobacterium arsenatis]|uniref:Lipoprotein n=1 Tax=Flavobacterium arsenatis TaxID=1484332 RepID=A0ABU1TUU7_9FLAO|nr:DUF4844 domain-containing protein [Flavobacterium arsenatis]MDR6969621.1 hypothetical protein [Flavobacterium arsenatis]
MKPSIIKYFLKTISVLLLTIFSSCTDMKNQTEEVINLNRTILTDDLKKLEEEKIITQSEFTQIKERLNADLDYYLQHQDIDFPGLEKMFFETIKSFENIKINQPLFSEISSTYGIITSQITMRQFPTIDKDDYEIGLKLNKVMNNWFENYQNDSEKLDDLIAQVNRTKQFKIHTDISDVEYDEMLATITKIKTDTTISATALKEILTDGMLKYCNKSNNSNLEILNIYGAIDRIKKLGIHDELSAIYEKKWTKPKEPSYAEMKQQVLGRFKILLSDEMITQQEYEEITKTIVADIDYCKKNTENKDKIKAKLLIGLAKLKDKLGDTEDREAIVDLYFILSQKTKVDIKSDLNMWLYGFDPK